MENGAVFSYKYFSSLYFNNIHGYNALMLSKRFYKQFAEYAYILIYQLDAYIFSDQLEFWCSKQYDYIGAPWLDDGEIGASPVFRPISVGNGGLSLRRVEKFISSCSVKTQWLKIIWFLSSVYEHLVKKSNKNYFYLIPRFLLRFPVKTLMKIWFLPKGVDNNEDIVFVKNIINNGSIPDNTIARFFSIENYPEYLFQLNNEKLPFGCHNWGTYCNYQFWKKYIHV
jgi:hypothetical protein